jgi:putative transcriptional regulator
MKDEDFQKLIRSVHQMGAIMRGEKVPHRRTTRHKTDVRHLRERIELTQTAFARMIGVSVRTLQNWEQGRREPDGPAKALLKVVEHQPKAVLAALHAA